MVRSAVLPRVLSLGTNPSKVALVRAVRGSVRDAGFSHLSGIAGARYRRAAAAAGEPLAHHRQATYRWLCAAQDATPGGGVAGFLDLWSGRWSEPYPETTGYIIPTFLAVSEAGLERDARERAVRMADWSCEVQMEDGAVLSGLLGGRPRPAVFNTGQAIFGWISAYQASGTERYAEAGRAAAEWLLAHQDPDGAWRRKLSTLTTASLHTYNGRCAWALAFAGKVLGEQRFLEAACRASDWVLTKQTDAGWFADNAFAADEVPLLHTISYAIEGLVGVYAFTGERQYLEGARRALDPIVSLRHRGHLPGRLDDGWRAAVSWRCPTGEAQIAVVLMRLDRHCPGRGYALLAARLLADVAGTQRALLGGAPIPARAEPAAGGVPGSFPIWGSYMRFALPNWAAKFYLDALLLQTAGVDEYGFPQLPAG